MNPYIIVHNLDLPNDYEMVIFINSICYFHRHPLGCYIEFNYGDGVYTREPYEEVKRIIRDAVSGTLTRRL